MTGQRAAQIHRDRGRGAGREGTTAQRVARQLIATPNPCDEGQLELAHDLEVLLNRGLIAAVSDGPEIRYALTGSGEVRR